MKYRVWIFDFELYSLRLEMVYHKTTFDDIEKKNMVQYQFYKGNVGNVRNHCKIWKLQAVVVSLFLFFCFLFLFLFLFFLFCVCFLNCPWYYVNLMLMIRSFFLYLLLIKDYIPLLIKTKLLINPKQHMISQI